MMQFIIISATNKTISIKRIPVKENIGYWAALFGEVSNQLLKLGNGDPIVAESAFVSVIETYLRV